MHDQLDAPNHTSKAPHSIKDFLMYFIKPTAFGVAMLVLMLHNCGVVQLGCLTEWPRINWTMAVIVVPVLYFIFNGLSSLLSAIGKPIRVFRLFVILLSSLIVISFLASIIMSKSYLGYYMHRPGVFNELHDVKEIKRIIPFQTEKKGGIHSIYFNLDYSMNDELERFARWPGYVLDARNLVLLKSMGLSLPKVSRLPPSSPDYYALVRDTGILVRPDPEHVEPALLRGLIIDLTDSGGRELVLIAARDGLSSGDHYPYYELLFEKQPGTDKLTLLSRQHFFGGEDDNEWYFVWIIFGTLGIFLAFLLTIIIAVAKGIIRWLAPKFRPPAPAP